MSSKISHLMVHILNYKPKTGEGNDGDPTYGNNVKRKVYFRAKNQRIRNSVGDEVASTHIATSDKKIPVDAAVWFPGDDKGDDSLCRVPIAATEETDPISGFVLYRLFL